MSEQITELLHSDIQILHEVQCGLGNPIRNFAFKCLYKLGFGYHNKHKVFKKYGIDSVIVLNAIPISWSNWDAIKIENRMNRLYNINIRKNITGQLESKLSYVWSDITSGVLNKIKAYKNVCGLGIQVSLVLLIYKDLQTYYTDLEQNRISIPKEKQANKFCWYLFVTLVPDFGGPTL